MLAEGTLYWGVSVERVEVKDVRVPEQLMRAMAAEAEAAREARAKVHTNIFLNPQMGSNCGLESHVIM